MKMQSNSCICESGYWDFGDTKEPKIHQIHAYPAKFPAFITQKAVSRARQQNIDVKRIADVFCGCGTTAYESSRMGLEFWGCDINPVAILIAKVKSNTYDVSELRKCLSKITEGYKSADKRKVAIKDLPQRLRYWFWDSDARNLRCLLQQIQTVVVFGEYQDFFLCAFSNILKSVSRWLTKSIKPQRDSEKKRVDVFCAFDAQVKRMLKAVEDEPKGNINKSVPDINRMNFLKGEIPEEFVDIIVTSPPYVTSYEYADIHQLSTMWLGYVKDYRELRDGTIGSVHKSNDSNSEAGYTINEVGLEMVSALKKIGSPKAKAALRYFVDMRKSIDRCKTLLRPGGMIFLVIGNTEYRGVKIDNAEYLVACLKDEGFTDVRKESRKVTGKNLSPYRTDDGKFSSDSSKRKIYAEEFVLTGRKPINA